MEYQQEKERNRPMAQPKTKIKQEDNEIIFWLKAENYPMEAIYATAYVFVDRLYVYLDGKAGKEIKISLKGKKEMKKKELVALQGEFLNELLNYLIRVEIAKRNKKIRELIVGSTLVSGLENDFFSSARKQGLKNNESWLNDPLGIAVPWEEKEGSKKKSASSKKSKKASKAKK